MAAVGAIPYYGFGFRFFPYAEDRADRMQLRISNINPVSFVSNFRPIWRGEYEDLGTTFDYFVEDVDDRDGPRRRASRSAAMCGKSARTCGSA